MEKRIYDKKTGIHYELQGDYYLPCLELPEQPRPLPQAEAPTEPTGETATFEIYQTSPPNLIYKPVDKLTAYLADIDEQAEDMFFRLVNQLAEKEGVTEQLKADNQMLWGAGLRWRPLPQAEAPTEPTGETANEQYP